MKSDKNVVVEISRTKVQFTINNIQLISKLVNAIFQIMKP